MLPKTMQVIIRYSRVVAGVSAPKYVDKVLAHKVAQFIMVPRGESRDGKEGRNRRILFLVIDTSKRGDLLNL